MKFRISFLAIVFICSNIPAQPWEKHGKIIVDPSNPHYLQYEDVKPFLWFGDTGWEMLHRLNREETEKYLENRAKKGFNVIQTVILSEFYEAQPVNYFGDSLFINHDPAKPAITKGNDPNVQEEYDYWDHVEYALSCAASKGLYVALLPTWGEWVIPRVSRAKFNTPAEAYNYGWFVADRYKKFKNIIWILGGDRHPDELRGGVDLWRAMAEGITDGVNSVKSFDGKAEYSTTLMSYHSFSSSSEWFHNDPWIDFHMWGSYHADFYIPRSWEVALSDWNLKNPKPTINGEPNYEEHNVNYGIENNAFFTAVDLRIAAYWSLFSGAAGFTYGAHSIWQFNDEKRPPYNKLTAGNWHKALDLPGAEDVIHIKKLMESFPVRNLVPDQSMIIGGQGNGANHIAAIRGDAHALIYIPTGAEIKVKLGIIEGLKVDASWFDPRTGDYTTIGTFDNNGERSFSVPGMSKDLTWLRSGRGCDWVLVLRSLKKL